MAAVWPVAVSRCAAADWTDASDQALTVQVCDSMGAVVLNATLTVGITPAA